MGTYEHSEAFHNLKYTKEAIEDNLTTSQYLIPLDYMLDKALEPVVQQMGPLVLNFLAKILAHQALRPNIKYNYDKVVLVNNYIKLTECLTMEGLDELRLNRGIKFALLAEVLRYKQLLDLSLDTPVYFTHRQQICNALGLKTSVAYVTLLEVEYWYTKATAFKGMIAEKFTRTTLNQAQKAYVDFKCTEPLDDVTQVFMFYLNKAIDRCDSRLGVLTTYINSWLQAARQAVKKDMSSTDTSLDKIIEEAPNLESLGSVDFDNTPDSMLTIAKVARQVDPEGAVRLSLGIPQYLTQEEMKILYDYAK